MSKVATYGREKARPLLTSDEVAERLNVAPATVVWWRSQRQGPKFVRLGKGKRAPVRYRPEAVDAFISQMEACSH